MRKPANKQTIKQTNKHTNKQTNRHTKAIAISHFSRDDYKIMWKYTTKWSYKLKNGTRRAQNPRKPLMFRSPNKQTNKQTNNKIWPHRGSNSRHTPSEHNALTDWVIGPYRSDYSYQSTIIRFFLSWIWLKSWSNQDLRTTVIRIQQDILDCNPVVDIHYLLFWEILLTNE